MQCPPGLLEVVEDLRPIPVRVDLADPGVNYRRGAHALQLVEEPVNVLRRDAQAQQVSEVHLIAGPDRAKQHVPFGELALRARRTGGKLILPDRANRRHIRAGVAHHLELCRARWPSRPE